jgi:hypothetical protein
MTGNVIDFEEAQDRRDEKQLDQFRKATVDRLTQNILAACEVDTIGAITPIVLALEQALMALLAVSCPQFRSGWHLVDSR